MIDEISMLDKLTTAGFKFDGHVTNGSASELLKIIDAEIEACYRAARGSDDPEAFKKYGTSQLYWKGRSAAANAVRARRFRKHD
jgi:hypothetical protein